MSGQFEDKMGEPIAVGDHVTTRFRGGRREGQVEAVIATTQELAETGDLGVDVKNPPKVVFTDQHGHKVAHNPGTLAHANCK